MTTSLSDLFTNREDPLRLVIETALEGIWALDPEGRTVYVNALMAEMLGYGEADMVGRFPLDFMDEGLHTQAVAHFAQWREGVCERHDFCWRRKDGSILWTMVSATPVHDTDGEFLGAFGMLADITEHKVAERALRERDDLLDGIVQTSLDAIITVDSDQRIVQFNPAAAVIFGCPVEEAIGQSLDRFIPPRFRSSHGEHVRQFGRHGGSPRPMGSRRDLSGLRVNGEEFPIEASTISQIDVGGIRRYTVFLRDITARKEADERLSRSHEQLRELSSRLRTLQEEERTRISREIHDELGQMLTGIRMDLRWIEKRVAMLQDPAEREACEHKLQGTVALVDDTIRTVQKIAAELRPAILDNLGLTTAIGYEATRFERRTGVSCEVHSEGEMTNVPPELSTAIFRIFQEILTNVARHAEATHLTVHLGGDPEMVELVATDDGRGIQAEEIENAKSLGLLGMRERASLLGGEVRLTGVPGTGTTVTVRIPRHHSRRGDS